METKQFMITAGFARRENLPTSFIGTVLKETARAVYIYGHGTKDPSGRCARCGRKLTHPGSILIGIGPECLGDWAERDVRMDNMTEGEKQYLAQLLESKTVDCWLPKRVIKDTTATDKTMDVPKEHKMLNGMTHKPQTNDQPARRAVATTGGNFNIYFPYDPQDVANVKTLQGRRYNPERKFWTAPINTENAIKLREWKFTIMGLDQKVLDRILNPFLDEQSLKPVNNIPGLKKDLYTFQAEGVGFLEAKSGRGLIADEMGLGKTVQALAYLQLHPELRPAVVVCPASVKLNWRNEAQDWMSSPRVRVLSGTSPQSTVGGDVLIINYDILADWLPTLQALNPKVLITDECHYYKSNSAKRTKAVKALAKQVPHFIALSGTPIVNRPIEAYNALSLISPGTIPRFWQYAQRYCNARHNGYGWDFSGASNTQELHEKLNKNVMIRRKKEDVLKDLPAKVRSFVPFELSNSEEYSAAEGDFINYVRTTKGSIAAERASNAEALAQINALRQIAVRGKLDEALAWIEDFLESGEKLIVFAVHKQVIDAVYSKFRNQAVKIDGGVPVAKRSEVVEVFQNSPDVRLFVGNIKAAGVGITLTASSSVAFLELPWTPGDLVQAEDRAHRIGQRASVNIYYLMAENTIDSVMARMLDAKRKVLDAVLDGASPEDGSLLTEIMNEYYDAEK